MAASPLTPLDYIAAGYWQDFLAGHPIAGGIAYESELRDCMLDESLASLQRVDTLLSQMRRDLIKAGKWQEDTLLNDERYRNFMVFLAFYAGRVLAQQWQHPARWYGQFELSKRYPELALTAEDFYQQMAVVYSDTSNNAAVTSLFFALAPIGSRLFGHIDRPFLAVSGKEVLSSLYQAVIARLPDSDAIHLNDANVNNANVNNISLNNTSLNNAGLNNTRSNSVSDQVPSQVPNQAANQLSHTASQPPLPEKTAPNKVSSESNLPTSEPPKHTLSKPTPKNQPVPPLASSKSVQGTPNQASSVARKPAPTPEIFTQLLTDLENMDVAQSAGITEYQQANKILNQFEQYIAKQDKPRAQIVFSKQHLAAKQQALLTLKKSAQMGNTAAMLRLAMYELLDEGLAVDTDVASEPADESGAEWVKQAASQDDSRAQRLLSKMYYQGVGVAQDMANGKYWLEQAAKNGHAEAAGVVSQWQQAQALISTKQQEQHSLKRYQLLFAAIIVMAILIFIIV